jgi:predicted GIY-YIG superfamily endonuclease
MAKREGALIMREYVYLVASTSAPVVKIGRSSDPVKRYWQHLAFGGVCPQDLKKSLVLAAYKQVADSISKEAEILEAVKSFPRIAPGSAEWLRVSPSQVPSLASLLGFDLFSIDAAITSASHIKTISEHKVNQ